MVKKIALGLVALARSTPGKATTRWVPGAWRFCKPSPTAKW